MGDCASAFLCCCGVRGGGNVGSGGVGFQEREAPVPLYYVQVEECWRLSTEVAWNR